MINNNKIAHPFVRILSFFIDFAVSLLPVVWFINWVSTSSDLNLFLGHTSMVIVFFFYPVAYALLVSLMVSKLGGTFGKLLTGTKIVDENGNNLSFWKAFFRNHIGYIISGILLWAGFIWVFIDGQRRAWHDQIAGSFVVVENNLFTVLGVISLGILMFIEFGMVTSAIANFKYHSGVYADLEATFSSLVSSASKNSAGSESPTQSSPAPGFTYGPTSAGSSTIDTACFKVTSPVFSTATNKINDCELTIKTGTDFSNQIDVTQFASSDSSLDQDIADWKNFNTNYVIVSERDLKVGGMPAHQIVFKTSATSTLNQTTVFVYTGSGKYQSVFGYPVSGFEISTVYDSNSPTKAELDYMLTHWTWK